MINRVFAPSKIELAWARRIVAVFDTNSGVGVVRMYDKMIDQPHLKHARKLLGM